MLPLNCAAMAGRLNTRSAFDQPRFCHNTLTTTPLGCDAYYYLGPNRRMRLCYNPTYPHVSYSTSCKATDYVLCDGPPSAPPPPPSTPPEPPSAPPARRRSLFERIFFRQKVNPDERL
jgi:hypothetical protein